MIGPLDLLAVAELLLSAGPTHPPPEAQLRRAVSTAYYAVFHTVLRAGAERFIGAGAQHAAGYALFYRGFNHGRIRSVCDALTVETLSRPMRQQLRRTAVSQQMREFSGAFSVLQQARHLADYDPSAGFELSDTSDTVQLAASAIAAFDQIEPNELAMSWPLCWSIREDERRLHHNSPSPRPAPGAQSTRGACKILIDLQAEYDNRAKIPGFAEYIAAWARDAAAFRAGRAAAADELDLAYGPTPRQALDLFWPDGRRDVPLALFIHGGYWQALDRSYFSHLATGLLAHGVAVAIPSYDLCPSVTLAVLVDQVRDAAAFLARRHPRPMLAIGHSAGGHLTAMLMATDWAARGLPARTVPAGLALSGLFDLAPLCATTINSGLRLDAAEARRLSPVFLPCPANADFNAVVGGDEGPEYERQSRIMADAWSGACEIVPGANHMVIADPLADPKSQLIRTTLRLIRGMARA